MSRQDGRVPDHGSGSAAADLVARLQRWHDFGGVWRVASRTAGTVTISFRRCDDGEEVDRLTSNDPRLLEWLGTRNESES
jgi:hypothetical protein